MRSNNRNLTQLNSQQNKEEIILIRPSNNINCLFDSRKVIITRYIKYINTFINQQYNKCPDWLFIFIKL